MYRAVRKSWQNECQPKNVLFGVLKIGNPLTPTQSKAGCAMCAFGE